jgi:hypothetical protein
LGEHVVKMLCMFSGNPTNVSLPSALFVVATHVEYFPPGRLLFHTVPQCFSTPPARVAMFPIEHGGFDRDIGFECLERINLYAEFEPKRETVAGREETLSPHLSPRSVFGTGFEPRRDVPGRFPGCDSSGSNPLDALPAPTFVRAEKCAGPDSNRTKTHSVRLPGFESVPAPSLGYCGPSLSARDRI